MDTLPSCKTLHSQEHLVQVLPSVDHHKHKVLTLASSSHFSDCKAVIRANRSCVSLLTDSLSLDTLVFAYMSRSQRLIHLGSITIISSITVTWVRGDRSRWNCNAAIKFAYVLPLSRKTNMLCVSTKTKTRVNR